VIPDHVHADPDAPGPTGRAAQAQRHVRAGEIQRKLRDVDHRLLAAVVTDGFRGPAAAFQMMADRRWLDLASVGVIGPGGVSHDAVL
jgi:hypothetical protein